MLIRQGETTVKRLNWGCGGYPEPGWINSDLIEGPDILSADIREGLPFERDSIDYAVTIHTLPEIPYPDLVPALEELRRVLKPGAPIRISLPDLDRGIQAYLNGEQDYFLVRDEEAQSIGAKFITHMLWYGHSRTLFTHDFIEELLLKAGFARVVRCAYQKTASPFPEIINLDDREPESLFVEAVK